jgi:hypothetical protein
MEATTTAREHAHHDHHHEPLPTSGRALDRVALSATLHCLTGCAIGEVLGMVIGTALGFSQWATVALAVVLAFLFGYGLTSLPLLRAGLALGAVIPIALASDTFSIATMEIVDNAIMVAIPGAMHSGVGDVLFWGALSFALVVAGLVAFPVNRWLLKRGKGHAAVHETGIHGGPPVKWVGVAAVAAAIFGSTVLAIEAFSDEEESHGGGHAAAQQEEAAPVRGLSVTDGGLTLQAERTQLRRGAEQTFSFRVVGEDGAPVRDFEVEHEKRMHLIVVRRDGSGFQHLHPRMTPDGTWATPITIDEAGDYRVFADFVHEGRAQTLATDVFVDGPVDHEALPRPAATADAGDGYQVKLHEPQRGMLEFDVTRDGKPVEVEPYLGAGGHLVALRQGDLAYLHVHPVMGEGGHGKEAGHGGAAEQIAFETEFPSAGRYALYLQFQHEGTVRTARFTRVQQ